MVNNRLCDEFVDAQQMDADVKSKRRREGREGRGTFPRLW